MAVPWRRAAGFDADAVDYFSRIASNGGGLQNGGYSERGTKRRLSDFFVSLKDLGLWSSISEMGVFLGVAGLPSCLVKAKFGAGTPASLTNVNFVGGDYSSTGAAAGIKGDGATKYLDTGVNQNTLLLNSASLWVYVSTPVANSTLEALIGSNTGTSRSHIIKETTNLVSARITSAAAFATTMALAKGVVGVNRAASGLADWRIAASAGSASSAAIAVGSSNLTIFARDGSSPTSSGIALYGFGTAIDLSALRAACDAVFSAFGGKP